MATSGDAAGERPKLNRTQRREQKRQVIRRLLDGPARQPVCGQAKAAARARAKAASRTEPRLPKGDRGVKAAARELQAATGRPYTECLIEVRTALAGRPRPAFDTLPERPL
ncbi:hypothetical protein [Streptomyces anandii]|uniref:hypothetical protein n=1 Tax=Streptomyces anandii TaxID=285454 RepID=UPI003791D5B2